MRPLSDSSTLLELLQERTYTAAQLRARPLTAHLAAPLEALHDSWLHALQTEVRLAEEVLRAEAAVEVADEQLDALLAAIVSTARNATGGDRGAPLYVRLLGTQRALDAQRPVLGEQLALMRSWRDVLAGSGVPALAVQEGPLVALIARADAALADKHAAEQALTDFTETGERRALLDKHVAARQGVYDALLALAEDDPSLPADFAERFFPREARAQVPTLDTVAASIRRLESQLARQRALHAQLLERKAESERARKSAELTALRSELGELEREQTARFARIAEVRARIDDLSE